MGNGKARLPPIDESLRDEFRQFVKESHEGNVKNHYRKDVERALREFINASKGGDTHDRLRRLENAVERIDDRTADLADDDTAKKKKDSKVSVGPRRRQKLDAIESQIAREAGDASKVHKSVIHKAIEDNAGTSGPTLRSYKRMLKERHIAFENPAEKASTWFVDTEAFVNVVESNYPERNGDIAAEYGEEWYQEQVDEFVDWKADDAPGFA